MSMPSALRLRDIRRVYHLVGEIKELGSDPKAWRLHALQELVHLLRGQVALSMDMVNAHPGAAPTVIAPLHVGWTNPKSGERYLQYVNEGEIRDDPAAQALFEKMQRRELVTATRRQLVGDELWYAAKSVYEARRGAGIDDFVCSCARLEPGTLQGFIIYRPWGAMPFGNTQRDLLRLFHVELIRILRATPAIPQNGDLPPRLREVMKLLSGGASAKQIARELGLTVNTVNSYCKSLYRRLGVEGKAEMLARQIEAPRQTSLVLPHQRDAAALAAVSRKNSMQ